MVHTDEEMHEIHVIKTSKGFSLLLLWKSEMKEKWENRNDEDYGSKNINDVMNSIEIWRSQQSALHCFVGVLLIAIFTDGVQ